MMGPRELARLLRTVRHLNAEQIAYQLRYRLAGGRSMSGRAAPEMPKLHWKPGDFLPPPAGRNEGGALRAGRFVFLNREVAAGWPPDWFAGGDEKLWSYNLHYFEWLWLLEAEEAQSVVEDWVAKCTPEKATTAWEPYPVSLRIINWLGFFAARRGARGISRPLWESIFSQVEWMRRRVEKHIGANHLLENAAALALAGSAFEGEAAGSWLSEGLALLKRELPLQFSDDGLHFELSPMYHLRATYLLELLSEWGAPEVAALAGPPLEGARQALAEVCHPDGGIALLNDSAFGVYHEPGVLRGAEISATVGAFALRDAGYYGFRETNGNYIVCDAGRLGPDFQPGHAHGDVLSFELSVGGRRVVTDTGVCEYSIGERRSVSRSTRAHNTVEIDGADQAEFWGGFRVGARPNVVVREWSSSPYGFVLEAEHDGYRRLACGALHRRRFEWGCGSGLVVEDWVHLLRPARLRVFLHLHPDCVVESASGDEATVARGDARVRVRMDGIGELRVVETPYFPEFGVELRRPALEYSVAADAGAVEFSTVLEIDG